MPIKLFHKGYNYRVTSCPVSTMLFTTSSRSAKSVWRFAVNAIASVFCSKYHITNESTVNIYVEYSQMKLLICVGLHLLIQIMPCIYVDCSDRVIHWSSNLDKYCRADCSSTQTTHTWQLVTQHSRDVTLTLTRRNGHMFATNKSMLDLVVLY